MKTESESESLVVCRMRELCDPRKSIWYKETSQPPRNPFERAQHNRRAASISLVRNAHKLQPNFRAVHQFGPISPVLLSYAIITLRFGARATRLFVFRLYTLGS